MTLIDTLLVRHTDDLVMSEARLRCDRCAAPFQQGALAGFVQHGHAEPDYGWRYTDAAGH
jgi:hypothetical protein